MAPSRSPVRVEIEARASASGPPSDPLSSAPETAPTSATSATPNPVTDLLVTVIATLRRWCPHAAPGVPAPQPLGQPREQMGADEAEPADDRPGDRQAASSIQERSDGRKHVPGSAEVAAQAAARARVHEAGDPHLGEGGGPDAGFQGLVLERHACQDGHPRQAPEEDVRPLV